MARCPFCRHEVGDEARQCLICGNELRAGAAIQQSFGRRGWRDTITESRQAAGLLGLRTIEEQLGGMVTHPETVSGAPVGNDTEPFRPRRRAAAALLCILDDGSDASGETIWIRKDRYLIGSRDKPEATRERPDAVIANDDDISSLHAELSRQWEEGRCHWTLKDLGSRNGTFLRIQSSPLKHGDEMLIGHRVFRFSSEQLDTGMATTPDGADDRNQTRRRQSFRPEDLRPPPPELVEATGDAGLRFTLSGSEQRIGRHSPCEILLADDPTVSRQHARLYMDERGVWHIADGDSLNGVWLRITEKLLEPDTEFQLGQQRFLFRFSPAPLVHVSPPEDPDGA